MKVIGSGRPMNVPNASRMILSAADRSPSSSGRTVISRLVLSSVFDCGFMIAPSLFILANIFHILVIAAMRKRRCDTFSAGVITVLLVISFYSSLSAQTPAASPTTSAATDAGQDSLKVFIQEVRIPISAKDTNGRFDPTVELDDLMLRENGIVQPLKSVYRVPASVLLLLDTGGEVNLAKS